jgi:hypothetical protein
MPILNTIYPRKHCHAFKSHPSMFSISPLFPRDDNAVYYSSRVTKQRHHPDVQRDVDMELDGLEDDENEEGSSRITSPGEAIASSSAVLRYVLSILHCQDPPIWKLVSCEAVMAHILKTKRW